MANPLPEFDTNNPDLVPSKNEWSNWSYDEFEVQAAEEKFGGKTVAQVLPFILEAGIGASLYFENMPNIPFRYYIRAYTELLDLSKNGAPDRDDVFVIASCFVTIVESALECNPERIISVMDKLMPTIDSISGDPRRYGFDTEDVDSVEAMPYSMEHQLNKIRELYAKLKPERKDK